MTVCLKVDRGRSIRGYRDGGRVRVEGDRRSSGRRDYGAFIYARIIRVAGKGYRVLVVTGVRCEPPNIEARRAVGGVVGGELGDDRLYRRRFGRLLGAGEDVV